MDGYHDGIARTRNASTTNDLACKAASEILNSIGQGKSRQSSKSVLALDDDDDDEEEEDDDDDDEDEDGYKPSRYDEDYEIPESKKKKPRTIKSSLRKSSIRKVQKASADANDSSVVSSISV